jgi:hypothetical protein
MKKGWHSPDTKLSNTTAPGGRKERRKTGREKDIKTGKNERKTRR